MQTATAVMVCAAATAVMAAATTGARGAQGESSTAAQPEAVISLSMARRIVQVFDFEERAFNPDPVPRFWNRAQHSPPHVDRPRYPSYNAAEFDYAVAHSGEASVRVPVRGGSAALRLAPGVITVFPGVGYAVTMNVRTDGTEHAAARVVARYLDADLAPVASSERRSRGVRTKGQWTTVAIDLPPAGARAAFLQIDLELVQPRDAGESAPLPERFNVWPEDTDAAAWFDDVAVYLIPTIELSVGSGAKIVRPDHRPELSLTVRDVVGEQLTARVRVRDAWSRLVFDEVAPVRTDGTPQIVRPPIEAYGPYRVNVSLSGPGGSLGDAELDFAWLAPLANKPESGRGSEGAPGGDLHEPSADATRLGVIAERLSTEQLAGLGELLAPLGDGFVAIAGYGPGLSAAEAVADAQRRRPHLSDLLDARREVTIVFTSVPPEVATADRVDDDAVASMVALAPEAFDRLADPLLDREGQRVRRWQLGPSVGMSESVSPGELSAAASAFWGTLRRLVPAPVPTLPWSAEVQPPGVESPGTWSFTVRVPASFVPATSGEMAQLWLEDGPHAEEVTFVLPFDPFAQRPPIDEAADLVERAVMLWSQIGPGDRSHLRLAVDAPWKYAAGPGDTAAGAEPTAAYPVWRTLADMLEGRRTIAIIEPLPGVKCVVLAPVGGDGPGVMVAWDEGGREGAAIEQYLGAGAIEVVDVFGNRTAVASPDPGARDPAHVIPLSATPVYVEGIDPRLVAMAGAVRFDEPFVPASTVEHVRDLLVGNPWPFRITGRLQVIEPNFGPAWIGWNLSPRAYMPFSLAPGETMRVPVTFSFGPAELAGEKLFKVRLEVAADRPHPPMVVRAPLRIGLAYVHLSPAVARAPDAAGQDLVVIAAVTNLGDSARTLTIDAIPPRGSGLPRQQQAVSNLGPGVTVVRRFVYAGCADALAGATFLVSVADAELPERLNLVADAPPLPPRPPLPARSLPWP